MVHFVFAAFRLKFILLGFFFFFFVNLSSFFCFALLRPALSTLLIFCDLISLSILVLIHALPLHLISFALWYSHKKCPRFYNSFFLRFTLLSFVQLCYAMPFGAFAFAVIPFFHLHIDISCIKCVYATTTTTTTMNTYIYTDLTWIYWFGRELSSGKMPRFI